MLSPRWRKVLRDLWVNKARTLLVALSIAVGVFAVGTVAHMQYIINEDLMRSYEAVNPAQAIIHTAEGFDDAFVTAVRRMDEVQEVEGRRSFTVKFRRPDDDAWHAMQVFAIPNYEDIRINKVLPETVFDPDPAAWPDPDVWPPPERALLLERTSLLLADLGLGRRVAQGDVILVETPVGKVREVPLAGLCYDFSRVPATFAGQAYGYVIFETLPWFGVPEDYNALHLLVTGDAGDWDHVKAQASAIRDRVERAGYTVTRVEVPEPGKLPLDAQFRAIAAILGVLGGFALFLAAFLVINTISALLSQHIRQIGVMKAVGARSQAIIWMYLSMVLAYSLMALIFSVPLAIFVSHHAVNITAYFINFQVSGFSVPPNVLALEILVGLLVPLVAALFPVISGARLTVREAITSYGLSADNFGQSWLDRVVERLQGLPRPLLLSIRNTFRRKLRLWFTLLTLILAGSVFIAVVSVRSSLDATLAASFQYWQFDVQVQFIRSYRVERLEYEARQVPGVVRVESWGSKSLYRLRPDGSESGAIFVIAPPAGTQMLQPQLLAGRWLQPGDTDQIVINNHLWAAEPDLAVGREMVLVFDGREETFDIVGIVQTVTPSSLAYVSYEYFAEVDRAVSQAGSIQVITEAHDAASQRAVARALEDHFERQGLRVATTSTSMGEQERNAFLFNVIVTLLMIMAVLMGSVGGLGLAGTMSLNVLERTREIGVMRAVGASDDAVLQIFMVEGIFIGLISWIVSILLAVPVGKLLSDAVGQRFFNTPLTYHFSWQGVAIWLVLVVLLSALSTYFPAQRAVRLSVREILSYE